jgi:flagellar biogenesis protein FliO
MRSSLNRVRRISHEYPESDKKGPPVQHKRSTTIIFILSLIVLLIGTYVWSVNRTTYENIRIKEKKIVEIINNKELTTNHVWMVEMESSVLGNRTELVVDEKLFDRYSVGKSLNVELKNGHVLTATE